MAFSHAYDGKRVLVTGHTGFKGAWLCEWLLQLGAQVIGYALAPPTEPSLFNVLGLASRLTDVRADIRDLVTFESALRTARPDYVFHLAAQSLVRPSYAQPMETYAVNVMGTVNVLEAVRRAGRACTVVVVTTDKCYENREWARGYSEDDPLGGYDPYSSSKAAAELVTAAYRRSFFSAQPAAVQLASARAGNVIGAGDWAVDRLIPDCIRSLQKGEEIPVRSQVATRPWQHVLEPLSGYLWLGARLTPTGQPAGEGDALRSAFNFGPRVESNRTVADVVREVLKHWPGRWVDRSDPGAVHEAKLLHLSTARAERELSWRPTWNFEQTVARTVEGYRFLATHPPTDAAAFVRGQISQYVEAATAANLAWSK
jgi:CDP-glucose 4,6-dehydratase